MEEELLTNRTCNKIIHNHKELILKCCEEYGTPFYIYSEALIKGNCKRVLKMPNEYGLIVRYAMKANSSKSIIRTINGCGVQIDASSFNEVKRAVLCGVPLDQIMYTSQEILLRPEERKEMEDLMLKGLKYNVCSLRQLELVAPFCGKHGLDLSMRIHPDCGEGSGESATRNTGDKYSCFGVLQSDLKKAIEILKKHLVKLTGIHVHIGSGGDPKKWKEMKDEAEADVQKLGEYARQKIIEYFKESGRKIEMEIEPGTFLVANAGFLVCSVLDKKSTSAFEFLILDGGMECITRPLLYGSRHPFFIISRKSRKVISDEYDLKEKKKTPKFVVVGKCCESGDSISIDGHGHIYAREMNAAPDLDDIFVVGGAGAYCSSMSPFNYNSHGQIPEIMILGDGKMKLIRKKQTIEEIIKNEM